MRRMPPAVDCSRGLSREKLRAMTADNDDKLDGTAVLDRAAHVRRDGESLNAHLNDARTLLVPVWRGQHLVSDGKAVLPTVEQLGALVDRGFELAWLGTLSGRGCFALDISPVDEPMEEPLLSGVGQLTDLRFAAGMMSDRDVGLLKFARGVLHWHRQTAFCGKCGGRTVSREGGHVRECGNCGAKHFPRTDPAVMMLVTRDDRCLLARQSGFPKGMVSALAGFVEPGECVEECVERETMEEVGLRVTNIRYFDSQGWPFPQSLMLGYRADALSDEIRLDEDELEEARWYTRAELERPEGFFYPPPFSLAHHLIKSFLAESES